MAFTSILFLHLFLFKQGISDNMFLINGSPIHIRNVTCSNTSKATALRGSGHMKPFIAFLLPVSLRLEALRTSLYTNLKDSKRRMKSIFQDQNELCQSSGPMCLAAHAHPHVATINMWQNIKTGNWKRIPSYAGDTVQTQFVNVGAQRIADSVSVPDRKVKVVTANNAGSRFMNREHVHLEELGRRSPLDSTQDSSSSIRNRRHVRFPSSHGTGRRPPFRSGKPPSSYGIGNQSRFGSRKPPSSYDIGSESRFGSGKPPSSYDSGSQSRFGSGKPPSSYDIGSQSRFGSGKPPSSYDTGSQSRFGSGKPPSSYDTRSQSRFGSIKPPSSYGIGSQSRFGSIKPPSSYDIGSQSRFGSIKPPSSHDIGSQSRFGSIKPPSSYDIGSQSRFGSSKPPSSYDTGSQKRFGSGKPRKPPKNKPDEETHNESDDEPEDEPYESHDEHHHPHHSEHHSPHKLEHHEHHAFSHPSSHKIESHSEHHNPHNNNHSERYPRFSASRNHINDFEVNPRPSFDGTEMKFWSFKPFDTGRASQSTFSLLIIALCLMVLCNALII